MRIPGSEVRLRAIFQNIPLGVVQLDSKREIIDVNPAFEDITEYRASELKGKSVFELVHPDDLRITRKVSERLDDAGFHVSRFRNRLIAKSGKILWVQMTGRAVARSEGEEPFLLFTVEDVTEVKRLQDSLEASHKLNRTILQSAQYAMISTSVEGIILQFNPEAERILGYQASEVIGKEKLTLFHDRRELERRAESLSSEYKTRVRGDFEALSFKPRMTWVDEREWTCVTKDGRRVAVQLNMTALRDESGCICGFLGIARDLTERKQLEEVVELERAKAIESARLASVGEMSADIAHEINNPLAILMGLSEAIRGAMRKEGIVCPTIQTHLDSLDRTTDRIAKIVRGLRNLSRDGSQDPFGLAPLRSLVEETVAFCRGRFQGADVELKVGGIPERIALECRPSQVSQIILNLLNNALDAVMNLPERWVELGIADLGDRLEITVTDSGRGVPAEIRDKILRPFFTTKPAGKGTGLGLSIIVGILEAHSGRLRLDESYPNTRFVVTLPKRQGPEVLPLSG